MKILHVENSSGRGGSLKSLMSLWPAPRHWQVEVVSLEREWAPEIDCPAPVTVMKKNSFTKAWRLLQRGRFDVVHINNALVESWSFVVAAWWEGIPVVSHFRSLRPLRKIEYLLSSLCDRLLLLSKAHQKRLPKRVSTEVMYNPIQDRGAANKVDALTIGVFSVLKAGKGHEDVIRALALTDLNWHLHVVGGAVSDQPSTENELKELCVQLNVQNKVTFHGHVNDPSSLMRECALVVDPSHKAEGFRRTVCEGALMSKAVLATRVGGAEDLLNNDELIAVGDVRAWQTVLSEKLQSTDNLYQRGRELRNKALAMFDPSQTRDRFWSLLDSMTSRDS